jgi:tripeptide aminopeptidase
VATSAQSITELFMELVRVPSPSGRERQLALFIREWLARAGVPSELDGTGPLNDSDAGNLIASVSGDAGAPRFLFVAHMDTVESGVPSIEPALGADGVVRSAGETILGADNKSAVAALMRLCEAVATMPEQERPTVHAAFTSREESGTMGASVLDLGERAIDYAYCVDGSDPVGTVLTRSLGQTVFTLLLRGRRAHAAANPEAGLSAIVLAGEIVTRFRLGRQPDGGSASVAAIVAGNVIARLRPDALGSLGLADGASGEELVLAALEATATNSVPDLALLRGEARGYSADSVTGTLATLERIVAEVCGAAGASYQWRVDHAAAIPPMPAAPDSPALARVQAAVRATPGTELLLRDRPVTIEASYLAPRYDAVALASGGRAPHELGEHIAVAELEQLEALLLGIVAPGAPPPR